MRGQIVAFNVICGKPPRCPALESALSVLSFCMGAFGEG